MKAVHFYISERNDQAKPRRSCYFVKGKFQPLLAAVFYKLPEFTVLAHVVPPLLTSQAVLQTSPYDRYISAII